MVYATFNAVRVGVLQGGGSERVCKRKRENRRECKTEKERERTVVHFHAASCFHRTISATTHNLGQRLFKLQGDEFPVICDDFSMSRDSKDNGNSV